MEELRQIAAAYCRSTSEEIKEKIREFFKSMNYEKHKRVALHEFLEFMRQKAKKHLANNKLDLEFMNTPEFFRKLDKDKKGLNFSDVETLYYIIQSGRPFCKGCGEFIKGMFFTCVSCFKHRSTCFSLCLHCYNAKKFIHKDNHKDTHKDTRRLFLDNFALLEAMRETASKAKMDGGVKKKNTSEGSTSSPGAIVPYKKPSTTKAITSSDLALVKVIKKPTRAKDTLEALEGAMNLAIAAAMAVPAFSAVCVIL